MKNWLCWVMIIVLWLSSIPAINTCTCIAEAVIIFPVHHITTYMVVYSSDCLRPAVLYELYPDTLLWTRILNSSRVIWIHWHGSSLDVTLTPELLNADIIVGYFLIKAPTRTRIQRGIFHIKPACVITRNSSQLLELLDSVDI